ncbi:MAG: hypothetical protein AB7T31_02895 [Gemmatimonadales bacterium]
MIAGSLPDVRLGLRATRVVFVLLLLLFVCGGLRPTEAQVTAADSAAVLLDAAGDLQAEGRADVAEALWRRILARYPTTAAAAEARARLAALPTQLRDGEAQGSGRVELSVWMTLYGAWLGAAVPAAFGADSPEPYGAGLLIGGPSGFFAGRALAGRLGLTEGQARAITLGGTWGTWQGFGWREVFEWGVTQNCSFGPCFDDESDTEETFGAMIVGGLAGIGVGALLSGREMTPGTASVVNFASLWGSWFGVAGGTLANLEGDDLLAATLVGGNAALLASALLAPSWNVSRSRARLVSIAGVLGGLGGLGLDLLIQPDDEDLALGIPLAGSVLGLGIGIAATREGSAVQEAMGAGPDGALLGIRDGRLALGTPALIPALIPAAASGRTGPTGPRPALRLGIFRAEF